MLVHFSYEPIRLWANINNKQRTACTYIVLIIARTTISAEGLETGMCAAVTTQSQIGELVGSFKIGLEYYYFKY